MEYDRRYGRYVVIRHPNGLRHYMGTSQHDCEPNDIVRAGDPIGLGGNTGRPMGLTYSRDEILRLCH